MMQNMMRKAMAAEVSGFTGVTLNFGSADSGYTTDFPRFWASTSGGTDDKAFATNVSMAALTPGATITATVFADTGPAPYVVYAKNDGAITSYTSGISVAYTDYLKVGITAPDQIAYGWGEVRIFANGTQVDAIPYVYDPA